MFKANSNPISETLPVFAVRRLNWLLTAVFLFRVSYLGISGLDLIGDESYYWDWSRRPDWCYYSKPPMVAWLIALSTGLFGDNSVAVRLPAAILGTLTLYYVHATAKANYSPQAGALAVLLMLAMPINVLNNFLMTIDAPLNCFWAMTMYYLRQALSEQRLKYWCCAGMTTGAALLSKQSALLLPAMLVVFLLLHPSRRQLFKREFPVYLAPVFICLLPVIVWNQQHEWVMFGHSQEHFGNARPLTWVMRLREAATFVLYQMLLISPIVFALMIVLSTIKLRRFHTLSDQEQLLLLLGPTLLFAIAGLSFIQTVQGNWAMPFYLSTVILVSGRSVDVPWREWLRPGWMLGIAMVALTYALPIAVRSLNLMDTRFDPTARFRHWREVAESVERTRQTLGAGREELMVITLGHRFLTSQLAFYLPDHPRVYRYGAGTRVDSQYEVWGWPDLNPGDSALIVTAEPPETLPATLTKSFGSFRFAGRFADPANPAGGYRLYLGENLQHWPAGTRRGNNE